MTASPVPNAIDCVTVLKSLDIFFIGSLFSGITIINFFMLAVLLASITHCSIGLPEIVCKGLGVSDNILFPFPALNIIEHISIKMLYNLRLEI